MVLSHSRQKYVLFQIKPFNASDFVKAHDMAFRYFGGRAEELVYDQDRVLAVSENAGNVLYTETFESYKQYAGFCVRLCRGYDPESKGKIEAVIKFVKNSYLKYRVYYGIDELNSGGLKWLDRTGKGQKHETTQMIPSRVFKEEAKHLRHVPLLSEPVKPKEALVRPTNVIHYLRNRYEVPRGTYFPGRKARIETEGSSVKFYCLATGELLAEHEIFEGIGKKISIPRNAARYKETKYDELKSKVMANFGSSLIARSYIDQIIERFPRYIRDQLNIISKAQELYDDAELEKALMYCEERELYSANDFRDTLIYFRQEEPLASIKPIELPAKYSIVTAHERSIETYALCIPGRDTV
jgi:hypothetical protein